MDEVLKKMIRASEKARKIDAVLKPLGYSDNPFFDIFGDIADAVYSLVGEKKDNFEESATYWALTGDVLPEEDKLDILLEIYRKNRPARL